ncbi:hypothetical protein H4R22_004638 [Coemansia sp. RSA 1290]|nr:hypothetical protein H4R22_004638 [Coemansia sp. RSA 1290]
MSAAHSEDVARAERTASLRLMRELASVLLQDTAALMADPHTAVLVDTHPIFQTPLFASRAFRDFAAYAAQAMSLQHVDTYTPASPMRPPPMQPTLSIPHLHTFAPSVPFSSPVSLVPQRAATSDMLPMHTPDPRFATRSRCHTFETIEEDPMSAPVASRSLGFNPLLLSQPLQLPPQQQQPASASAACNVSVAFPQLNEEPEPEQEPLTQQYLMQIIDYLSVYNQQQPQSAQVSSQQQLLPMSVPASIQPHLLANMPQSADASAMAAAMSMMCSAPAQLSTNAATAQFPRLASESSESTASPELPSSVTAKPSSQQHQQQSRMFMHNLVQAQVAEPLASGQSAAGQLMYFTQDCIDPSALIGGTATPPAHMSLPKLHNSVSPSSNSPTPTPSSSSPGLPPATAQPPAASLPPNALHFAVAPQKIQFKADHELFM